MSRDVHAVKTGVSGKTSVQRNWRGRNAVVVSVKELTNQGPLLPPTSKAGLRLSPISNANRARTKSGRWHGWTLTLNCVKLGFHMLHTQYPVGASASVLKHPSRSHLWFCTGLDYRPGLTALTNFCINLLLFASSHFFFLFEHLSELKELCPCPLFSSPALWLPASHWSTCCDCFEPMMTCIARHMTTSICIKLFAWQTAPQGGGGTDFILDLKLNNDFMR